MKKTLILIQLTLLSIYIYGAIFSELLADIISPIHNIFAGVIIIYALKFIKKYRISWILLSLMTISWGLTDVLWAYLSIFTEIDPNEMTFFMYLYFIPNLLLLGSVIVYFSANVKKWNKFQLLLDITAITIIILGVCSAVFFSKMSYSHMEFIDFFSLVLYVITDIITLVIIFVMISSSRLNHLSRVLKMIITAYLTYILADLFYTDSYFNDLYVPNSISDVMFLVAFAMFAISALIRINNPIEYTDSGNDKNPSNFGKSHIIWWILIIPIILFVLGRLSISYLTSIFFVILVYQLFAHYIQKSMLIEVLYNKEIELKKQLEILVKERTSELEVVNMELKKKAITDSLTGLYNREYFLTLIKEKIKDYKQPFSVFYMDLNRFKVINDLHGHHIGDEVLITISRRFSEYLNGDCLIARIGGDDFGILYNTNDYGKLQTFSSQIIDIINEPMQIDQYKFHLDVSIGIARYPDDGETVNDLMKYADIAMYHAKSLDSSEKHVLYSSNLTESIKRRNHIELLLRNADYDKEFKLYYQPQFDTHTKELVGMEALIRWFHPDEGFISPAEFIPISEEIGSILQISDWVFESAIKQIKQWHDVNDNLVMSMNLSPVTLDRADFFPKLEALIRKIDVKPSKLDFEITEHSVMNRSPAMEEVFAALINLGVKLSIDDFGTGYSSLSYIKHFDVDTLKIAKELIDNIETDLNEKLIVKAIIMMAKGMGLKTIAEGVETEKQLSILENLDCNFIQGYVLGRPVSADEFDRLYL